MIVRDARSERVLDRNGFRGPRPEESGERSESLRSGEVRIVVSEPDLSGPVTITSGEEAYRPLWRR